MMPLQKPGLYLLLSLDSQCDKKSIMSSDVIEKSLRGFEKGPYYDT